MADVPLNAWTHEYAEEPPRRLSDRTHELARMALAGEFGKLLVEADFGPSPAELDGLSPDHRYSAAILSVARHAPLRILPGQRIVGAATLADAARHATPVAGVPSTSHTTIGFHRVLPLGTNALRAQVCERLDRGDLEPERVGFLQSMRECLDALDIWRERHVAALADLAAQAPGPEREAYLALRGMLERVPAEPPRSFAEAVQSLWFMWAFQRLCGNWSGLGRVDEMLGPYLEADLEAGLITLDEARELLAHFWINGCEWTGAGWVFGGSGDAQFYQNVVLAGVNADGAEVANEVTYLILDVVEELHISDFPIAVRLNARSPERLLRRVAQVQRYGGGIVAVYNEDTVLKGLVNFGYAPEEARTFANDGCWEVIIPGRTTFGYWPFDLLALLHETLGLYDESAAAPNWPDYETLYAAFLQDLDRKIDEIHALADRHMTSGPPAPLLSLFVEDCIENARSYYERGPRYAVLAPHAGGMANTANSLLALRKLVYEEQRLTLPQFIEVLRQDWEGYEDLRRTVLNSWLGYGNDDPAADAVMKRLFDDYTERVARVPERAGVKRPAGISTFGRELAWTEGDRPRAASPDGHHAAEVLATNFSPSPGTDRQGPTAALKSYCGMDLTRVPNGATLELKMFPGSLRGEEGLAALIGLMRTFVELGGFFLQVDVVDTDLLREAQAHPEKYPNLAVRISGWSARFATLNKQWQDMIINRTQQRL